MQTSNAALFPDAEVSPGTFTQRWLRRVAHEHTRALVTLSMLLVSVFSALLGFPQPRLYVPALKPSVTVGKNPVVQVSVANRGNATARGMRISTEIVRSRRPPGANDRVFDALSDTLLKQTPRTTWDVAPLVPGDTHGEELLGDDPVLTKEDLRDLKLDKLRIYVFGTFSFYGPLGLRKQIRFCAFINGNWQNDITPEAYTVHFCPYQNEVD